MTAVKESGRVKNPITKEISPIEPVYRLIGAKIESMRCALGWTQDDLAKRIGLTRASIANAETGRQRLMLHTIEQIASAFQTTPKHFLRGIWT